MPVIGARPGAIGNQIERLRPGIYRKRQIPMVLLVGALFCALPLAFGSEYEMGIINRWLLYAIVGTGLYLIVGLSGQLSFATAAFYGIGAYSAAWGAREFNEPWFGVVAAVVITAAVALLFSLLVLRTRQFYFAIASLAFASITVVFLRSNFLGFTAPGGEAQQIPPLRFFGTIVDTEYREFWLVLSATVLVLLLTALIERSPLRREALAFRENATVASTLGQSSVAIRLTMFAAGSAIGGLAGALFAFGNGFVSTDFFTVQLGLNVILVVLLGGLDSMWGPLVGAFVITLAPENLAFLNDNLELAFSVLLLVVIVWFPRGIVGGVVSLRRRLSRPHETSEPPAIRTVVEQVASDARRV